MNKVVPKVRTNEYNNQFLPQINENNEHVYLQCVVCGSKYTQLRELFLERLVEVTCLNCRNQICVDLVKIQARQWGLDNDKNISQSNVNNYSVRIY